VQFSPAMQQVVRSLESTDGHTPATLAAALNRPLTIDDVAPFIRFDAKNYVRNLVTRAGGWELRLLCWRPGQTSSLHGHGAAACSFRVIRGSATEAILGERDRVWAPGDVVEEIKDQLVHQVGNTGADSLITLHAYSPHLPVDSPSSREGKHVVIVGGGFAGVAVATHMLRRAGNDLRITLVERGPWLGRGIAYGVDSSVFRLNVPAAKMSIDPDDPMDFVRWAGAEETPSAFLPRSTYGSYVVQRFRDALRASPGKLRVVRGDAASIEEDAVVMLDGTRIRAEKVVLATGLAPRITRTGGLPSDSRIVDAWDEVALAALPREGRILILGAGLPALDVLAFPAPPKFRGPADNLSRPCRGARTPATRAGAAPKLTEDQLEAAPAELRGLLRWGRAIVRDLESKGSPWQHGIDAFRPHVAALWRQLPPADRATFVKKVRPYWDVLRHRAPTEAHATVEQWCGSGRLSLMAGSVAQCHANGDGLDVTLRMTGGGAREQRYDAIVRCIGPALEGIESNGPVVATLIRNGIASADPAGLGIVTDEVGRVVGPAGASDRLFALGALRRASSWETTAVPDISVHAHALARLILP